MSRNQFYDADLAYIHHNGFGDFATEAAPELLKILRCHGIANGTLLDLGCGSGIWARAAQNAGFHVVGIDQSQAMIDLARTVSPKSHFRCASLHAAAFPRCDVISAIGEAFSFLSAGPSLPLTALFRRLAKALRPGGLLIFDLIVAEGPPLTARTWKAGKDWAILTETSEGRSRRRLTRAMVTFREVHGGYRRASETHEVRLFRSKTVQRSLRVAGFSFKTTESYGKMPLLTRRRAFIGRRVE